MVKVVIGSAFGDEGKGLMTDYFVNELQNNPVVVRYNSSAQCSHTVVTPENKIYHFGHVGSGTFCGVPTFFSKHMVVNPNLLSAELKELKEQFNIVPKLYADPQCLVTTPFDAMLNQLLEMSRGKSRHGSCGIGFGQTIERNLTLPFTLKDMQLNRWDDFIKLCEQHFYNQIESLNLKSTFNGVGWSKSLISNILFETQLNVKEFLESVEITDFKFHDCDLVFEGGQGLWLDQSYGMFPHVTRSNTGIKNVVDLINDFNLQEQDIEFCYMSRIYQHRHGDGPMFGKESQTCLYNKSHELANPPNKWQGKFRYGRLSEEMLNLIFVDLVHIQRLFYSHTVNVSVCFTWMDIIQDTIYFLDFENKEIDMSVQQFNSFINTKFKDFGIYFSYGETRDTVKCCVFC